MKLFKLGQLAIAVPTIVIALGLAACGGDDNSKDSKSGHATSALAAAQALPPMPTVAELNTSLQRALDPSIPAVEKLALVQGIQSDPDLPNRLAQAYREANIVAEVTNVAMIGDTVNAEGKIVVNGQENVFTVPFVAEDGKWKVDKNWACSALSMMGQESVACNS